MSEYLLLIHSAKQIVPVADKGELLLRGASMKDIVVLVAPEGDGYSLLVNK